MNLEGLLCRLGSAQWGTVCLLKELMICPCWTSPRGRVCPESLRHPTRSRCRCRCTIPRPARHAWPLSWRRRSRSVSLSASASSNTCPVGSSTRAQNPPTRRSKSVWSAWWTLSTATRSGSCPACTSITWTALTPGSCAPSPALPVWSRSTLHCCLPTRPTESACAYRGHANDNAMNTLGTVEWTNEGGVTVCVCVC